MPRQARNGWPIVVRTVLIDDLIEKSIAEGCDCVVNLAAGLDSRPYRLTLPANLTWIEVDLPAMIDLKERLLSAAVPKCRLLRRRADLADPSARLRTFDELGSISSRTWWRRSRVSWWRAQMSAGGSSTWPARTC
jgi:O-methyltransferase involved in polyketide biosynthesis